MISRQIKLFTAALFVFFVFTKTSTGQTFIAEGQMEVAMRMIGHKVLLNSKDSVSRVLPIEKIDNRYRIPFKEKFQLNPDILASTVTEVMQETGFAKSYLVEVEKCDSDSIVYSYFVNTEDSSDVIPCRSRILPVDCYQIYFSVLDKAETPADVKLVATNTTDDSNAGFYSANIISWAAICIVILIVAVWVMKRKKKTTSTHFDPDKIHLGSFTFDKRNMQLYSKNETIELTSKEADLLSLLHTSVNNTIEREIILKTVWGDEGDYVGRTLDVFISKLRKKLEADARIKIVNTRGIGYKLILND